MRNCNLSQWIFIICASCVSSYSQPQIDFRATVLDSTLLYGKVPGSYINLSLVIEDPPIGMFASEVAVKYDPNIFTFLGYIKGPLASDYWMLPNLIEDEGGDRIVTVTGAEIGVSPNFEPFEDKVLLTFNFLVISDIPIGGTYISFPKINLGVWSSDNSDAQTSGLTSIIASHEGDTYVLVVNKTGDINFDGHLDFNDYFAFQDYFGLKRGGDNYFPPFDLQEDGVLDGFDAFIIVDNFGRLSNDIIVPNNKYTFDAEAPDLDIGIELSKPLEDIVSNEPILITIKGYNLSDIKYFHISFRVFPIDAFDIENITFQPSSNDLLGNDLSLTELPVLVSSDGVVQVGAFSPYGFPLNGDVILGTLILNSSTNYEQILQKVIDIKQITLGNTPSQFYTLNDEKLDLRKSYIPSHLSEDADIVMNFPNPVTDGTYTTFWFQRSPPLKIKIFNIGGVLIKTLDISGIGNSIEWHLDDNYGNAVKPGLYIYTLLEKNDVIGRGILKIDPL